MMTYSVPYPSNTIKKALVFPPVTREYEGIVLALLALIL
jgi:hypothetical protein